MPKLLIKTGEKKSLVYRLNAEEVSIGRNPSNVIMLPDKRISRLHARIIKKDNDYILEDMGSTNGTFINNLLVTKQALRFGDEIKLGDTILEFLSLSDPEDTSLKNGTRPKVVYEERIPEGFTVKMVMLPEEVRPIEAALTRPDIAGLEGAYKKLMILYRINYNLSTFTEMAQLLDSILELVLEVMKAERGFIMLIDDKTGELLSQSTLKREGLQDTEEITISKSIANRVLKTGEAVLTSDATQDLRFREVESVIAKGIRSAICVPLKVKDKIVGIMYVDTRTKALGFTEGDLELMTAIASQAAIVSENAKLLDGLRKANVELKERQAQLLQAEKLSALGRFSSEIAHEINNPLTSILNYAQLSCERLMSGKTAEEELKKIIGFLRILVNEVHRCQTITQNLLQFARRKEARMGPADVNKILETALAIAEYRMKKFNIEEIRQWDDNLPQIMADKDQLQQVFLNMIINANDAMEENGGTLTVTTARFKENWVEIIFKDTGCGIPEGQLESIFLPLYTTKPEGKGTGLGLSISLEIIERHHGTIDVESEVDKGTTFIIRLPLSGKEQMR